MVDERCTVDAVSRTGLEGGEVMVPHPFTVIIVSIVLVVFLIMAQGCTPRYLQGVCTVNDRIEGKC